MARREISDPAHEETERMIAEIEKKVKREYRQAAKEMQAKLDDYFRRFQIKDEIHRREVHDGEMSEADYLQWRTNQMLVGDRWKEMRDNLALDLHNSNRIARSIVSGYMPDAYAANFNYGTFQVEKLAQADTSFTLYDRHTVERILRDDPQILQPPGKRMLANFGQFDAYKRGEDATLHPATKAAFDKLIASNKDIRWQKGKLQSVTLQAVLQGESIPNMAKRIANTMGELNRNATVRYARTAMTEAQNAGRVGSYNRAKKMGINVKNQWMATHDSRTRSSHVRLDGEIREVGEKFSNGCEYPGDPGGEPAEIWNCRCTLLPVLADYDFSTDISYDGKIDDMTYEEWKEAHEPKKEKRKQHTVVQGTDISKTWKRRADKFDFEIEDVINAQGFDGLPRVVSAEEFDKAVSENGIICMRGYTAPNEETLKQYQNALYYGDWYVDCSKGGAAFGQGMYTAGNFSTEMSDQMRKEATGYGGYGIGITETLTLDKPKLINHDDLNAERWKAQYEIYKDAIGVSLTEEQDTILRLFCNAITSQEEGMRAYGLLSTNVNDVKFITEEKARVTGIKEVSELVNRTLSMNDGSFAAMRGYDAIQVDINSRGDKYFVVLNRTKCIFKGE